MLFHLDYFYKVLLHIRKTRSIFAPATNPNGFTFFQRLSARLARALVPFLELVRARIRNTRGVENGILLNHDTNTIEALAALHISGPHMMHTESRNKINGGHRAAPVTLRQKRPGRDRDLNNPSVARV